MPPPRTNAIILLLEASILYGCLAMLFDGQDDYEREECEIK